MMDRRSFFKISAGAAMAGMYGFEPASRIFAASGNSIDKIGVQLYSVRNLMQQDFAGTLAAVAGAGYDEVEFAGYYDNEPQQVRDLLDELGLDGVAGHFPRLVFQDQLDDLIESSKTIGHRYLILPWLDPKERTIDGYKALATFSNEVGQACSDAGLTFGYHNHDFELQAIDGKVPLDLLLEETDPALVAFELDLFWVLKGGGDPLDYFERYPGRFALSHVKDMTADGEMVDVGAGSIDFTAIFARADQAGMKHFIVEHDEPADPVASIRASRQHLSALRF